MSSVPLGLHLAFAVCAAALVCAAAAVAAPEIDHTTYIVALPDANRETLARVEAAGGVIDHFDGHEVRAYVHISNWARFLAAGIPHRVVAQQPPATKQTGPYPSYTEVGAFLAAAAEDYPGIVRVISLGQSVQGRELWAIKITDNPDVEEDEPEFAYISTMHGDEKVGTVLCLNFITLLLEGYGQDTPITEWIDETVIWLVPLMNPDGYELDIRWNANNRDLNRSFPEYPDDFTGTVLDEGLPGTAGLEPEVARVMDWTLANSFVLTANYHSGALVVNYPYDEIPGIPSGADAPTPDDALMRSLATGYAELNPPMFASSSFPGGITNGSAWYSISGGMQDWHYRYAGAIDFTLEVSNVKSPGASTLAGLWDDNRDAMFAYLARVHRGVRGLVTDRVSGEPLFAGVWVDDNPQPVFTDPDVGDYHRLLLPGSYTVRVEAPGYIPFSAGTAAVGEGPAVRLDAGLSNGDVNRDGSVDAVDMQICINAALGLSESTDADVDGGGVTATDIQHLVNRVLGRH